MRDYKGQYILAVEGNPPLGQDGMFCFPGGKPFVEKLKHAAKDAKAVIAWGSCASWGCVQAAKPNPTQAVPIHHVIKDKPIIKVPGCPPIAVKGRSSRRVAGAEDFVITRNEVLTGKNLDGDYRLALVEVHPTDPGQDQLRYLARPFASTGTDDFRVTRFTLNWRRTWQQGGPPR